MCGKAKTGALKLKKGKVKKKGKLEPSDEAIDAIKKDQKGLCVGDKCFTGDTLVYTKHGYKPIKEIRKGDKVYSRDEKTGEKSLKEVIETFRTTTHTVYHIWAGGKEEFKTTAYHPVYVKEQGWVTAINLCEGDTIETMDGFVHITKVEKTRHEEPVAVYNFHVKDWASYFVGKIKCYVHNDERNHKEIFSSLSDLMTPDEAARYEAYFTKDAPDMVIPGIKELDGIHLHHNSLKGIDEIQPWKAYYDDYGRLMARTDYNAGNKAAGIPNIHYHLYEWGKGYANWKKPHEYASHLKGEFR